MTDVTRSGFQSWAALGARLPVCRGAKMTDTTRKGCEAHPPRTAQRQGSTSRCRFRSYTLPPQGHGGDRRDEEGFRGALHQPLLRPQLRDAEVAGGCAARPLRNGGWLMCTSIVDDRMLGELANRACSPKLRHQP